MSSFEYILDVCNVNICCNYNWSPLACPTSSSPPSSNLRAGILDQQLLLQVGQLGALDGARLGAQVGARFGAPEQGMWSSFGAVVTVGLSAPGGALWSTGSSPALQAGLDRSPAGDDGRRAQERPLPRANRQSNALEKKGQKSSNALQKKGQKSSNALEKRGKKERMH